MKKQIEQCVIEIVDSFEKTGFYIYDNNIFSKCYGQDVPNIMNGLMTNHNINTKDIFKKSFNKMIGFNKSKTIYFLEKD